MPALTPERIAEIRTWADEVSPDRPAALALALRHIDELLGHVEALDSAPELVVRLQARPALALQVLDDLRVLGVWRKRPTRHHHRGDSAEEWERRDIRTGRVYLEVFLWLGAWRVFFPEEELIREHGKFETREFAQAYADNHAPAGWALMQEGT